MQIVHKVHTKKNYFKNALNVKKPRV